MTALHLHPEGLGYGPAREARFETERALSRALPASFLALTGLLFAVAVVLRLLPAAPMEIAFAIPTPHNTGIFEIPPAGGVRPPSVTPWHPTTGGQVVPVVDTEVLPTEPVSGGNTHGTTSVPPGSGPGTIDGEPDGGVAPDSPPGTWVFTDQLPEHVSTPAPEYPDLAREAGVEGTVKLWALVDLDGSVKAVQVIRSVPLLDEAAISALKRWRFTPALANGHPVRVWVAVPVRFSLH